MVTGLRSRQLVEALSGYAMRAVVIADSEGEMADYVRTLIDAGTLPADDGLLQVEPRGVQLLCGGTHRLVSELARTPDVGRDAAEIWLTAGVLLR